LSFLALAHAAQPPELAMQVRGVLIVPTACSDNLDNDGDGAIDSNDIGCRDAASDTESPQCQDGINNDPGQDALIDFDGGASAGLPPSEQTAPDPQCGLAWSKEGGTACGLGMELVALAWPPGRLRARAARAS
jgi:hypothetical protein